MKRKDITKYLMIIALISISIRMIGRAIKDTKRSSFDEKRKRFKFR